MKKSVVFALIVGVILSICSFSQAASKGEFLYVMGHGAAENSIGDLYCKKFKELVEAKTDGVVTVDVYSGNQLGGYPEMMQSLRDGDIGGMIFQPSPAVSFVPELAVLDIPYAFLGMNQAQIDKVLKDTLCLIQSEGLQGYEFC